MSHLRTTLLLNAPIDRVWDAYTTAHHVSAWLPGAGGLCASRPLTREGANYALRFSRWHRSRIQVVGVEPHKLHQRRFRDIAGHLRGTVTTQFEDVDGITRVTVDLNYSFAPLLLDGLLDRLFGSDIRQQAERELESFQHYVEQQAQPGRTRLRKTVTMTIAAVPAC
jgi:uncharacterized protein YndB with AHSA1/START domain